MIDYKLEPVLSYTGTLASPPELIGPAPEGIRINFYSTGGEFSGPKVRGRLRPTGGDWMVVRADGIALLDVRTTFETEDDALILVTYQGMIDLGPHGHESFLQGDLPVVARMRTAPRFLTSHPRYLWLNRLQCVGIGEYRAATNVANYDVYAIV